MFSWKKAKEGLLAFLSTVARSYMHYFVPIGMLMLMNMSVALHAYDMEKQGILWLHYAQLGETERDASFPARSRKTADGLRAKDRELILSAV